MLTQGFFFFTLGGVGEGANFVFYFFEKKY